MFVATEAGCDWKGEEAKIHKLDFITVMDRPTSRLLTRLLKWHDRTVTFFEGVTSLEGPAEFIGCRMQ
jgi:hypothetical protein